MSDEFLFSGLKVLDVGTWIAGPVAATILADFGADVIKVELPGAGDQYRILSETPGTPDAEVNYCWQMDARNKRSLTLNLKTSEGMEVLHKLVSECDIFVTNHPLPMRRAVKLNYEDLKPLNPGMIYASLTAYGEQGAERDKEGFDLVAYWANTGLMDLVRDPGSPPAQALPGMGDHPTAVALYAGIVTALLKKERTGEGSMVHTSLLGNGLWSMSCIAQAGFAGGSFERYRAMREIPSFVRSLYKAKDNRWLQFTMVRSEEELKTLLRVLALDHLLADPKFSTPEARMEHSAELAREISLVIKIQHSGEWMNLFESHDLNVTRVGLVEEIIHDDQVRVNDIVVQPVDGEMDMPWVINHPVKIDSISQVGPKRAPEVGEHSDEILRELGYGEDVIESYRGSGII